MFMYARNLQISKHLIEHSKFGFISKLRAECYTRLGKGGAVSSSVSSRVHIADDSIADSRMSKGRNYGQCNEITVNGEQYIYELQLTYAGDPIWIKRQGGTQWRRSAWTVPSQIVPGSGALKETQRVKPCDQSRLLIWIYDIPQIEYSYEIHMNYSNKTRRWLTI